jgi:hypothetical protein
MRKKTLPGLVFALAVGVTCPLAVLGLTLGPAGAAEMIIKDDSVHTDRPVKLDITGSVGFLGYNRIGLAGWVSMPIVPDGFIRPINDSFNLEFGATMDYAFRTLGANCDYSYVDLAPMAGVRWDFYLTEAWTVFGKLKAGVGNQFGGAECNGIKYNDYSGLHFVSDGGVGAFWNFSEGMGMRFDLGSQGIAVGLSINF